MRVVLVTSDLALLDAAIDDHRGLGRALGCDVAEGRDVFSQSLRRTRDAVAADPGSACWGARFFVVEEPRTLVGWGGFKGPPRAGVVELGYAVAPGWEGRGVATAAVRELLREAFAAPDVQSEHRGHIAPPERFIACTDDLSVGLGHGDALSRRDLRHYV